MVMIILSILSDGYYYQDGSAIPMEATAEITTTTTALAITTVLVGNRGYRHGGYHGGHGFHCGHGFMAVAGTRRPRWKTLIEQPLLGMGMLEITVDPSHAYLERLPIP